MSIPRARRARYVLYAHGEENAGFRSSHLAARVRVVVGSFPRERVRYKRVEIMLFFSLRAIINNPLESERSFLGLSTTDVVRR